MSRTETEVRRRRECQECTRRFTTFETVEDVPVMIVKKDGRREVFSREKVFAGVAVLSITVDQSAAFQANVAYSSFKSA